MVLRFSAEYLFVITLSNKMYHIVASSSLLISKPILVLYEFSNSKTCRETFVGEISGNPLANRAVSQLDLIYG